LCRGKLVDDIFQPPNAGMKLPYDMNDEHLEPAPAALRAT
jgi:hypothetical protein